MEAGLRIVPIPTLKKRHASPPPAPDYSNLLRDKSRSNPLPLKPLFFSDLSFFRSNTFRNYSMKTVYLSNYSKKAFSSPSWNKPCIKMSLSKAIGGTILDMFIKTAKNFAKGKLSQPLDKTTRPRSRGSRSVSASAVTHGGHSSRQSGNGTDSDPFTSPNDTSTPSERTSNRSRRTKSKHEHSTISSSDPEFSIILRREVKTLCEQNKNYIDPAFISRDSNSSHSPNTSGSKEFTQRQDYSGNASVYDDVNPNAQSYYFENGYYYPSPPMYVNSGYTPVQQSQFARGWQQNWQHQAPTGYNMRFTDVRQEQGPLPQQQRKEECKKLDPSAPAYEQKRKQKPVEIAHPKEEKKEVKQAQPKCQRKPLGNAAGNTIRQIIKRRNQKLKCVKAKEETPAETRKESINRRAKSREYIKNKAEVDDNAIESDAQEDNYPKKKEVKKVSQVLKIKKQQNVVKIRDSATLSSKFPDI